MRETTHRRAGRGARPGPAAGPGRLRQRRQRRRQPAARPTERRPTLRRPAPPWPSSTRRGKVKVGTKFDQPLFGLKNLDGKPEGFDVEIAKLIAGELGIAADKIEFVEAVSANRGAVHPEGKVDFVVATYTINDTRKQVVDFAGPVLRGRPGHHGRQGRRHGITGPERPRRQEGLLGHGLHAGREHRGQVDPKAELVPFDIYSECAEALKNGRVEAVTTDNVILLGLVSRTTDAFKLVGKPFTKEPYGIGVKKGDNDVPRLHQRHPGEGRAATGAGRRPRTPRRQGGRRDPDARRRSTATEPSRRRRAGTWTPSVDNLDLFCQGFVATLAPDLVSCVSRCVLGHAARGHAGVARSRRSRAAGAAYVERGPQHPADGGVLLRRVRAARGRHPPVVLRLRGDRR